MASNKQKQQRKRQRAIEWAQRQREIDMTLAENMKPLPEPRPETEPEWTMDTVRHAWGKPLTYKPVHPRDGSAYTYAHKKTKVGK